MLITLFPYITSNHFCYAYPLISSPVATLHFRMTIVLVLIFSVSIVSMSLFPHLFFNTSRSSLYSLLTLSYSLSYIICCFATRKHLCIYFLLFRVNYDIYVPLSSSWQVQVPYTKVQFKRFRDFRWFVQIRCHSNILCLA